MKKKIKKSVSKRFKITKRGKVLFSHQYKSHLKLNKSSSRKRRQKEPGVLKGRFAVKVKKMLGAQWISYETEKHKQSLNFMKTRNINFRQTKSERSATRSYKTFGKYLKGVLKRYGKS